MPVPDQWETLLLMLDCGFLVVDLTQPCSNLRCAKPRNFQSKKTSDVRLRHPASTKMSPTFEIWVKMGLIVPATQFEIF